MMLAALLLVTALCTTSAGPTVTWTSTIYDNTIYETAVPEAMTYGNTFTAQAIEPVVKIDGYEGRACLDWRFYRDRDDVLHLFCGYVEEPEAS